MRGFVAALLCCAMVAAGCDDDDDNTCGHPDKAMYSCEPVPVGTPDSCTGGPGGDFLGLPVQDPDKAFPVGCRATLPICEAYYPGSVQTCDCTGGGMYVGWGCPL
jgi:hypothetical protein